MLLRRVVSAAVATVVSAVSLITSTTVAKVDTMKSITEVADNFYIMDYSYDYDINDIVKNGYICTAGMIAEVMVDYAVGLEPHGFACSTYNAKTPDGDYIFGRNFDYMEAPSMLVRTDPEDGYASIGMVNLELIGYKSFTPDTAITKPLTALAPYAVVDGINEKGLSVGVLEIENDPTVQLSLKTNINTTAMVRIVLDKAATVAEAVELFGQYDMIDMLTGGCTYHYQLADAYGSSAVIEYADNEMYVIYPEKAEGCAVDYQAATNFLLTPGAEDPDGMGQDRYEIMMNTLAAKKAVLTEEEGMALLKAVSVQDEDMNGYICSTLWSSLYNNTDKTLSLVLNNQFDTVLSFGVDSALSSQI